MIKIVRRPALVHKLPGKITGYENVCALNFPGFFCKFFLHDIKYSRYEIEVRNICFLGLFFDTFTPKARTRFFTFNVNNLHEF